MGPLEKKHRLEKSVLPLNRVLVLARRSASSLAASGAGQDRFEFAALDLLQHGLAGDAEGSAGVVQGEPAGGGVVDEHAA